MEFKDYVNIIMSYGIERDTAENIAQAILNYEIYGEEEEDTIHFQVVYMYNSDKETEYAEDYTADEYEDACSDYKYFVEQKDCAYVILQKLQVINDEEEKYILEEYHSEEEE